MLAGVTIIKQQNSNKCDNVFMQKQSVLSFVCIPEHLLYNRSSISISGSHKITAIELYTKSKIGNFLVRHVLHVISVQPQVS